MTAPPPVYADHNATTPVLPEVVQAMVDALSAAGNPASVHGFGRAARAMLEQARAEVAALLNAAPAEIVFTSGGTEANNAAIFASGRSRVLLSTIEHDSVDAAAPEGPRIPVQTNGVADLAALDASLRTSNEPALVSLMLSNNETGVIQPVAEAVAIARRHGALIHCDAVQAVGKIVVDVEALGVDYMSVSAHKIGGPAGIGAIYVRTGAPWRAPQVGGGQERSRRAGTENISGAVGFAVACRTVGRDGIMSSRVRDRFEAALMDHTSDIEIFGRDAPRLPNTSCIRMFGVAAQVQVMAFDLAGVAVSAGAACSSGKVAASRVLKAMGASAATASEAIRVSFGRSSTIADADRAAKVWRETYDRLSPAAAKAARAA
jgi:cysteine desulfurase